MKYEIERLRRKIDRLKEKNKVCIRALEFYADESKYNERGDYWQIVNDEGRTARKAIEMVRGKQQ